MKTPKSRNEMITEFLYDSLENEEIIFNFVPHLKMNFDESHPVIKYLDPQEEWIFSIEDEAIYGDGSTLEECETELFEAFNRIYHNVVLKDDSELTEEAKQLKQQFLTRIQIERKL